MKVHDNEYGAWGLALKEAQGGGLPCGSIKASAEGGLKTAQRFKALVQRREARRAAAMEQGNPRPCAGSGDAHLPVMYVNPFLPVQGELHGDAAFSAIQVLG